VSSSDKIKQKADLFFFLQRYWTSLVLELEGYENVCIVRSHNQGNGQGRRFTKYKGKHRFVHLTLPIVSTWDDVEVGDLNVKDQDVTVVDCNNNDDIGETTIIYQYPFEWQLPIHLPGSFWSTREEGQPRVNESYCNVDYFLMAHLQPKEKEEENVVHPKMMTRRRSSIFSSPPPPMTKKTSSPTVLLQIVAKQRPLKSINGHTEEESYQRLTLLGFPRCTVFLGYIMLGFGCDRHILKPNSFVTIDIFGRNVSRVNIQQLQVQWIEHVHGTVKGKDFTLKTVLAQVTTSKNHDHPGGMGDEWLAQPKSILDDSSCCPSSSSSSSSSSCCSCWWGSGGGGDSSSSSSSSSSRGEKAEDDCCSSMCGGRTTTKSEPRGKDDREKLYYGRRSSRARESYLSTMSYPQKQLRLLVPQQARYSYEGAMIQVRHELVVTVETSGGCWVPSPSISCRTFVRPLLDDDEHDSAGHYSILWEEEDDLSPTLTQRKETTNEDQGTNTSHPTRAEGFEKLNLVSTVEGGSTLSGPITTIIASTIHWPLVENHSSASASSVSKPLRGRKT
jgi:hypothetical protein